MAAVNAVGMAGSVCGVAPLPTPARTQHGIDNGQFKACRPCRAVPIVRCEHPTSPTSPSSSPAHSQHSHRQPGCTPLSAPSSIGGRTPPAPMSTSSAAVAMAVAALGDASTSQTGLGDFGNHNKASSPVPRVCSLRAFESSALPMTQMQLQVEQLQRSSASGARSLVLLLAAEAESRLQVQAFERFAGRSAMLGVAVALALELTTGSGVFSGLDGSCLVAMASVPVAIGCAAGAVNFVAASSDVASFVQRRTWLLLNEVIDKGVDRIMDGLFSDL